MHLEVPSPQSQNNKTLIPDGVLRALDEKAAANYIGMSVSFLRKDRMEGKIAGRTLGPDFIKIGRRVVYLRDQLDAWLEQHQVARLH